jgi:hypothetical protein
MVMQVIIDRIVAHLARFWHSGRLRDLDQVAEFRCSALVKYCGNVVEHHVTASGLLRGNQLGHILGHFERRVLIPRQLFL